MDHEAFIRGGDVAAGLNVLEVSTVGTAGKLISVRLNLGGQMLIDVVRLAAQDRIGTDSPRPNSTLGVVTADLLDPLQIGDSAPRRSADRPAAATS